MIRSRKITNAARGQQCQIQIAGVCNNSPDTVVFCHFPDESHGIAKKADDISGAFGCSACHNVVDGRVRSDEWRAHRLFYMRRAQTRTIRALFELGVIKIA
jgi:hypothetical protein